MNVLVKPPDSNQSEHLTPTLKSILIRYLLQKLTNSSVLVFGVFTITWLTSQNVDAFLFSCIEKSTLASTLAMDHCANYG